MKEEFKDVGLTEAGMDVDPEVSDAFSGGEERKEEATPLVSAYWVSFSI